MKKYTTIILIIAMLISLIGCSNPDTSENTGTDASIDNKKDKIVATVTTEILTLDPQISAGTPAEVVREQMFEGLVDVNEKNEVSPLLAEEWSVSDDGLKWTFKLKKGVKFHDGEDFTAKDVKSTFDRYLNNEASTRVYIYKNILQTIVVDDYTVKFVTEIPQASFLNIMAYGGGAIMSTKSLERDNDTIGKEPVGTGPFKLKEAVTNEYVTMERFDDYWAGKSDIAEIKFMTVKEASTRVNMVETGEADFIMGVTSQDLERIKDNKELTIQYADSNRVSHIGFNMEKEPFNNKLVRQAMNYAIDTDAIVNGIFSGEGVPAKSVIAPATWGFYDSNMYDYNPEKAKELLKEAGYPDGFTAKIWTPEGRYFKDKETVMAIAGQLEQVGIKLEVEVVDWAQYLKELKVSNTEGNKVQSYFLGWESTTGEANYLFNSVFSSKNIAPVGWNTMFYRNEKVDELNELSSSCLDDDERNEYFKEMQTIIMEDAPWIPIHVWGQVAVYRSDLENITLLPIEVPVFSKTTIKN